MSEVPDRVTRIVELDRKARALKGKIARAIKRRDELLAKIYSAKDELHGVRAQLADLGVRR